MSAASAVKVEAVTLRYGLTTALHEVNLHVEPGSILALIGPNGAGKTTLIRILTTLLRPTSGTAVVAGFDVMTQSAEVRRRIGMAGQYVAVDHELTGRENLVLFARLLGLSRANARARATELLAEFGLTDAAERRVGTYSGGMRRRLDLAASVIARPEVLFLDEPTEGLDPASRIVLWEVVRRYAAQGTTIFLTTHYLEEADELADRIVLIDRGRITADGTSADLKQRVGGYAVAITTRSVEDGATAEQALRAQGFRFASAKDSTLLYVPIDASVELLALAQHLSASGAHITDIRVDTPSLDDVFLALTGQVSSGEADGDGQALTGEMRPSRSRRAR